MKVVNFVQVYRNYSIRLLNKVRFSFSLYSSSNVALFINYLYFSFFYFIFRKHLSAPFESSQLTIVERCLLTAQLFGDIYETAFWRVVAYQLLASGDKKKEDEFSSRWRRFGLTDLVWDELTEEANYRSAVVERVNRLVHSNTLEESKLCVRFLLLLGKYITLDY